MARLPDLVRDSKLETHFLTDGGFETVHLFHEPDPSSRQRVVSRSEHWQRQRKIGSGAFGRVFLERRTKGGRDGVQVRAVKQIDTDSQYAQVNYNRELEAIAKFSHRKYERCFVKSFGWYESPESLFITMEFLELGDLHAYLHCKPPIPEHEAKNITYQILDGLNLMHENEFTHRDLKPKNILLRSCPPDEWWVKIADFGISKRIEDGLGLSSTLKGTPGYIAPELYGFTKIGSPYACDIWATGEITFQMLTKQPAFKDLKLLFDYAIKPENFPSNQLFAVQASQLGVEFIISLMSPTPNERMSAKDALQHGWMDQLVHYNSASVDPYYKEPYATSVVDTMTEEFATWNSIKSSEVPQTTIPIKIEEFRALPLQTTGKKMTRRSPVYNATSHSSDSISVTSAFNDEMVRPLDVTTRKASHEPEGYTESTRPATFLTDSKPLGPGAIDNMVGPWDPTTTGERYKLKGHTGRVLEVAFSPDSKLLASGSDDMTVKLWDTNTGTTLHTLKHTGGVWGVAFSPNGNLLASGSSDRTVKLWDPNTGTIFHTLKGHTHWVNGVAFSPDSKLLASGSDDKTVKLWDTNTGMVLYTLKGHISGVNGVAFSPSDKLVASGSSDRTVRLWDTNTGTTLHTLEGHISGVNDVAFSPDSKLVASGSVDMTVKLWDPHTGTIFHTLKGHTDWVNGIAFSPNGKLLASGSVDMTVKLWDTNTGMVLHTLKGHVGGVNNVTYSPNGKLVASGSDDKTLRIWGFVGSSTVKTSRKFKFFG